jgi:hypothetical protein
MTKYRYAKPKLKRLSIRPSHMGYVNAARAFEEGAHSAVVIAHLMADRTLIAEAELAHVKPAELARKIATETWPKRYLKTGRITL